MGIEPTYSAWKAEVLPLNYTRRYCGPAHVNSPFIIQPIETAGKKTTAKDPGSEPPIVEIR